jgi:hypothetical protein
MPIPDQVTEAMLQAAVKKAVEVKLLPKAGFEDQIAANWERIKAVVQAALDAGERPDYREKAVNEVDRCPLCGEPIDPTIRYCSACDLLCRH